MTSEDDASRQDRIARDRLLERVDANVGNIMGDLKSLISAFVDHKKDDKIEFERLAKSLFEKKEADAMFYGKIYGGSAVAGFAGALILKLIFKM